jgi:hypothetical protein
VIEEDEDVNRYQLYGAGLALTLVLSASTAWAQAEKKDIATFAPTSTLGAFGVGPVWEAADGPLPPAAGTEVHYDFDPLHPFAGLKTAKKWANLFKRTAEVDPNDPFHNLTPFEWWSALPPLPMTWRGAWANAVRKGTSFKDFYNTLQGSAGDGFTAEARSPYPFETAEEHYNAWLKAAKGGTKHTVVNLPDWSGDWRDPPQASGFPIVLVRDFWRAVSDAYKPRYELMLQAELEGRHWWPADSCVPESFSASGRFLMVTPTMVLMNSTGQYQHDRYIFTDGRGFLDAEHAIPQWLGESQGFWDGDELVVWTKNIMANTRGHGAPENSDQLQVIERYKKIGNEMLVDVTWYDPLAFSFPLHGTSIQTKASDAVDAWKRTTVTLNECVSSNLVYHNELGLLADFAIGDPRYHDLFDQTPWTTVFKKGEKAKLEGKIPAAPSFLSLSGVSTLPADPSTVK